MKKYWPLGTCQIPLIVSLYLMYDSVRSRPSIKILPLTSLTVSPGRPTRRFTNVPPSPHCCSAFGGVLNTMMSPRDGLEKSRQMRQASTRSEKCARQPGLVGDCAQCSVGSIDEDGIRYGLTTHCLSASTIRIAPTIVTAQSI